MFPHMVLIHNQDYNSVRLGDVEEEFKKRLKGLQLSTEEIRGKRVGIAVGSRGIDKIQQIVRMTVEAVRKSGGEPYIFGAMGSHGNGTARGQREILASLGVTEEETGAPVLFGVLLTENAVHELNGIYMERPENFLETEKRLLEKVKRGRMKLPSDSIDVLIVDEMGKNISGSGMDTKVIGRVYVTGQREPKSPRVKRLAVLGLTEESHGNAIGIGLADFSTRAVLEKTDFAATAKNAVASMAPAQGKIPCILENDREAIRAALETAGLEDIERARVVRIQNTNQIARLYVSEALYEELKEDPEIRLLGGPLPMEFDGQGNLKPGHYGKGDR